MSDVTLLLDAAAAGDRKAAADVLPLVYDELRKLATARMAAESPDQTLQPTALVHEAYLRLVGTPIADSSGSADRRWENRGHFFAAAAEAMRRILVEAARRKKADKRGGGRRRLDAATIEVAAPETGDDLLAIDAALDQLAVVDSRSLLCRYDHGDGTASMQQFEFVDSNTFKARYFRQDSTGQILHETRRTHTRIQRPASIPATRISPKRPEQMKIVDRLAAEWRNTPSQRTTVGPILGGRFIELIDTDEATGNSDYMLI